MFVEVREVNSEARVFLLLAAFLLPVIATVIGLSLLLHMWIGEGPSMVIMSIVGWLTGYKFLPWVAEKSARWF